MWPQNCRLIVGAHPAAAVLAVRRQHCWQLVHRLLLLQRRGLRVLVSCRRSLLLLLTMPHTNHPAALGAGPPRRLGQQKKKCKGRSTAK